LTRTNLPSAWWKSKQCSLALSFSAPLADSLTPKLMVSKVRKIVVDWKYDAISISYPGPVLRNRPIAEPWNLGKGWVGFNFEAAIAK
jgi:hypothetical protein